MFVSQEPMESLLAAREAFLDFVRKRVGATDLAEDILQEALLRAVRAAPAIAEQERLAAWFYTVLRNAVTDAYRRRGVERRHLHPLGDLDLPEADAEAEAQICECFRELIPSLKAEYADVIERLDLAPGSTDAVAAALGITPTNLKVRRHRARQALRKRLEETCRTCAEHGCLDCTCR